MRGTADTRTTVRAEESISRPRIVRLIPVLDFGGVEANFVQQSRLLDRKRFDLRVCTFWKRGAAAQQIEANGVPVDVLEVDPAIRNPRATGALLRYLRTTRPDIVHASIGEANFHAALVGRLAGVRAVVLEEQGLPARGLVGRVVHAGLYRAVDAIVGVSDTTCRYLVDREWAPASCVRRIYNSAGEEFFSAPLPERASVGFHLLSVGRLVEVKNHATLIRAFAMAARERPGLRLTIVGEGPLRGELERLVVEMGMEGRVSLPGFRADIRALLDSAHAFALPSFSEGCSVALVEAMARALPVLASNAPSLVEAMGPKAAEWTTDPRDVQAWTQRIVRLADSSREERDALGRWARERAGAYSPRAHIASVQALYEELLRSKGRDV